MGNNGEGKKRDLIFQINADRKKSGVPVSDRRAAELKELGDKFNRMAETLKSCKDCEEWFCYACDNENCANNEKEPYCSGAKDVDEGKCYKTKDLQLVCKDCDEWQCAWCDNE